MNKFLLCVAAAASIAAGCASTETGDEPAAAERPAREYATGSNIPKRSKAEGADGVQVYDRESLERSRGAVPAPSPTQR
jgi:hypothetical protein